MAASVYGFLTWDAAAQKTKRVSSDGITPKFLSVTVGSSFLEIKEVLGAFDFGGVKLSNIMDGAIASDVASKGQLDAAILVEVTARNAAIVAEVTARNSAITSAVNVEVTARATADLAEVTARDAAIGSAILSEVTARNSAIGSAILVEVTARDAAISGAISGINTATIWKPGCFLASGDATLNAASNGTTVASLLPLSDDETPKLVIGDFAAGQLILSKAGTSSKVFSVYDDTGTLKITDVGMDPIALHYTYAVQNDLPVSPGSNEGVALYNYNGTDLVRIGSFAWNLATGINLDTFTPAAGTVVTGDTIQAALQKDVANLFAEITAREAAILGEITARDAAIGSAVLVEVTARNSAITSAVNVEVTAREAADLAEVTARDAAISSAVLVEVTARNSAITSAVNVEVTARASADLAEVTARDAAIGSAILVEVTARNLAISGAVLAEVTARDAAISSAILVEVTARNAAITSAVNVEVTARASADLAEVTARDAAISSAVLVEVTARNSAITSAVNVEVTARASADLAEVTARDAAIGSAILSEVTARNSAITSAINVEVTARNAAITAATSSSVSRTNDNASAITVGQVAYIKSNGNVDLALASVAVMPDAELVIVKDTSIASAAPGLVYVAGLIGGFTGLTPGKMVYVSRDTAGAMTQSLSGFVAGEHVYSIGRAASATEIEFAPSYVMEY